MKNPMFEPMNDSIIIKLLEDEGVTKSGIVLPDSADPMFSKGVIKAIGPGKLGEDGRRFVPGSEVCGEEKAPQKEWYLNVGDKVLFARYSAVKITEGDETFYFSKEIDILAKITD